MKIRNGDFVIGIVGRIVEQKGHKYLFQAVAKLKNQIQNIKLLIIGEGKLKDIMRQYTCELKIEGNVNFLGLRMDVPDLYPIMDVLCLPSIYEGLGLVLAEAMLCNIITVGSKIHGIKEIIKDGVNGFLVPPRNSDALAKVLYKIYSSNFDKDMYVRAGKTALRFNYRKNLRKIEKEYLKILKD